MTRDREGKIRKYETSIASSGLTVKYLDKDQSTDDIYSRRYFFRERQPSRNYLYRKKSREHPSIFLYNKFSLFPSTCQLFDRIANKWKNNGPLFYVSPVTPSGM